MTHAKSSRPRQRLNSFAALGLSLAFLATAGGYAIQQMPDGELVTLDLFGMQIGLSTGQESRVFDLTFREAR